MTPDRAREIVDRCLATLESIPEAVAAESSREIAEAVKRERERCAGVARNWKSTALGGIAIKRHEENIAMSVGHEIEHGAL
jgi:hypothetical protein